MTQKIGTQVRLVLSRAHADDPALRLRDDYEFLVSDNQLRCALDVPDAAAPIKIGADLQRRSIAISMELSAPKDKQRASSRINWLVRQLNKSVPDDLYVRSRWPGRAGDIQVSLEEARNNPSSLERGREGMVPNSFEVLLVRDLAGKFSGAKTFIEALEEAVPHFYEQVGQHLRPYVATPPKLKEAGQPDAAEQGQISPITMSLGTAPPPPEMLLAVPAISREEPPVETAAVNPLGIGGPNPEL
jgi:hypothetical protein